jgi:hypothetical protein
VGVVGCGSLACDSAAAAEVVVVVVVVGLRRVYEMGVRGRLGSE